MKSGRRGNDDLVEPKRQKAVERGLTGCIGEIREEELSRLGIRIERANKLQLTAGFDSLDRRRIVAARNRPASDDSEAFHEARPPLRKARASDEKVRGDGSSLAAATAWAQAAD